MYNGNAVIAAFTDTPVHGSNGIVVVVVVVGGMVVVVVVVGTIQSKIAAKSKVSHGEVVVVVVVGQLPELKNPSSKSGQVVNELICPNWSQEPPKLVDKHQTVLPVEKYI